MLPHLFLCRHGETAWNAERRIQGQADVPLNALGRVQAQRNGAVLRDRLGAGAPGWAFLASPMRRTRETMEILRGALGLAPDDYPTDPRLMELNFGDWQGSTLSEIGARTPGALAERERAKWDPAPRRSSRRHGALAERERAKWDYVPPGAGAESYAMLEERMAPVFEALAQPTILVAHGGIARSFLRRYGGVARDAAAHMPIAQDRVLEAREGRIEWV